MPDEDNKKKKFNPYLAPTEGEDEPKLDDEDEDTPQPSEDEQVEEEFGDDDDGGQVAVQTPDQEMYEVDEMADASNEKPQEAPVVAATPEVKAEKPRSWSLSALGLILILMLCDIVAQRMGIQWFWTPRTIYSMSYVLRAGTLLVAAYAWHRSLFRDDRIAFRSVFIWLGLVSGILLALLRFIGEPSFWAFINMVVEPLDSTILALAMWYIVQHLTTKLKLIKQTV